MFQFKKFAWTLLNKVFREKVRMLVYSCHISLYITICILLTSNSMVSRAIW